MALSQTRSRSAFPSRAGVTGIASSGSFRRRATSVAVRREERIRERYAEEDNFSRDSLLAMLIERHKGSFKALDHELSDDHALVTERLQQMIFKNAANFLHVFRAVGRANSLVQELKRNALRTKMVITSLSKLSFARDAAVISSKSGSGGGSNSNNTDSQRGAGSRADSRNLSVSLISSSPFTTSSNGRGVVDMLSSRSLLLASGKANIPQDLSSSKASKLSKTNSGLHLQSSSAGLSSMMSPAGIAGPQTTEDILRFIDVAVEEVMQHIDVGQHEEAAVTLQFLQSQATAFGAAPLLLVLEESLVKSIVEHLHSLPMSSVYFTPLHVPLLRLLVRLGRAHMVAELFFELQTRWIDGEMKNLHTKVPPKNLCRVATDFLVTAMLSVVEAQQNLCSGDDVKGRNSSSNTSSRLPPSSAAVLWVRERVELLGRDVISTFLLSFGLGADGGDPSRVRSAIVSLSESVTVIKRMEDAGFAHCETHLVRFLSSALMFLFEDFANRFEQRLKTTGHSLVGAVGDSVRAHYRPQGPPPPATLSSCVEGVMRRNDASSRDLAARLSSLPLSPHVMLFEFFLAPASSNLFERRLRKRLASTALDQRLGTSEERDPRALLSREKYVFLATLDGCSFLARLTIQAVVDFIAALGGSKLLSCESPKNAIAMLHEQETRWRFLHGNALIAEAIDATIQQVFFSFFKVMGDQRQGVEALASYVAAKYAKVAIPLVGCSVTSLLFSRRSPQWLFDALYNIISETVAAFILVDYFTSGRAIANMVSDSASVQVHHVTLLRKKLHSRAQTLINRLLASILEVVPVSKSAAAAGTPSSPVPPAAAPAPSGLNSASFSIKDETVARFVQLLVRSKYDTSDGTGIKPQDQPVDVRRGNYWLVSQVIPAYPSFPMPFDDLVTTIAGEKKEKTKPASSSVNLADRAFLFHLCSQVTLNLVYFFQGKLLDGSNTPVANSTSSPDFLALIERVGPLDVAPNGFWTMKPANYVGAVSVLQYTILKVVEDCLCVPATWKAIFGSNWSQSDAALKQISLFFSLFYHIWGQLFANPSSASQAGGGSVTPPPQSPTSANKGETSTSTPPVSAFYSPTGTILPAKSVLSVLWNGDDLQQQMPQPTATASNSVFNSKQSGTHRHAAQRTAPSLTSVTSATPTDVLAARISSFAVSSGLQQLTPSILFGDENMRLAVKCATSINMAPFVWKSSLDGTTDEASDEDEEEDEEDEEEIGPAKPVAAVKPEASSTTKPVRPELFLNDVRELLALVLAPIS